MDNIIELHNINKVYGTAVKTQVLFDVDLSFEAGSFNSIIGQSGSGKSTLLNILGTLDKPTQGNVLLNGKDVSKMKSKELATLRNQTIGFIFQFHYLLPEFTALQNILLPSRIKNGSVKPETMKRALELIEFVGLTAVKDNPSSKMSGGQQQRTAIARALINNPRIILADEPTGNLDSDSAEQIYQLMRDINRKFGTTFIIITHDQQIAQKTDRIVEIKDGRILLDLRK
ncbi:MAG: ABC transporter ATP-binding protein [Erysipelotrichaceae bacterium]